MSIFKGEFDEEELKYICVDYFEHTTKREATTFFLSHCHSDHMKGLFSRNSYRTYIQELFSRSEQTILYCSEITQLFLRNNPNIHIPNDRVKALEICVPIDITVYPNKTDIDKVKPYEVTVTLLPAGHCPGSVMFLFELKTLRVLFTGDFRINVGDLAKMNALFDLDGKLKIIHSMYFDNTFYSPQFEAFPSRKKALECIVEVINDWRSKGKGRIIKMELSARYGSEFLFIGLSKHYETKIHVSREAYDNYYKYIPMLEKAVTPKPSASTFIHSCQESQKGRFCDLCNEDELARKIKPCALSFSKSQLEKGPIKYIYGQSYKIAYSCHNSSSELQAILDYLSPKKLVPIAKTYNGVSSMKEDAENSVEPTSKKPKLEDSFNESKWVVPEMFPEKTISFSDVEDPSDGSQ